MILATRIRKARRRSLAPLLDADVDENFDRDVAGLCEQAQRCGLVGTDDAYAASSDDGWRAFCGRHGTYGFDWTYERWVEAERVRRIEEQATQARLAAQRRERQVATKLQADQAWWESSQPAAQQRRQLEEAERRRQQAERERQASEVARQHEIEAQAEWRRQAQAQQRADAEYHQRQQAILSAQMADAQRAWSALEPSYATQQFIRVTLNREIRTRVNGIEIVLSGTTWAPWVVLHSYLFR